MCPARYRPRPACRESNRYRPRRDRGCRRWRATHSWPGGRGRLSPGTCDSRARPLEPNGACPRRGRCSGRIRRRRIRDHHGLRRPGLDAHRSRRGGSTPVQPDPIPCLRGRAACRRPGQAILLLRARTLAQGHSGVRPIVVERLVEMLDRDILPIIPSQGSVGGIGRPRPFAHMALPLIGEGRVKVDGTIVPAAASGLAPLALQAKEGLSLLNGTEGMTAMGALSLHEARQLLISCDAACAMTIEAMMGVPDLSGRTCTVCVRTPARSRRPDASPRSSTPARSEPATSTISTMPCRMHIHSGAPHRYMGQWPTHWTIWRTCSPGRWNQSSTTRSSSRTPVRSSRRQLPWPAARLRARLRRHRRSRARLHLRAPHRSSPRPGTIERPSRLSRQQPGACNPDT